MYNIEYDLPLTDDPEVMELISELISRSHELYLKLEAKDIVGKELILLKGVTLEEN